MPIFVAWGNIQQHYPLEQIPTSFLTAELRQIRNGNQRIQRRQRSRWIAHFLLMELLKTAKQPTALLGQISRTPTGRPHFANPLLDFNISHSGDWIAVALFVAENATTPTIGVDIEHPLRQRPFKALLSHFASQQEVDWFCQQQNEESAFYRSWCLREAVLKSQGVGIAKLAEVQHHPHNRTIYTPHCPSGQLIFSAELPFYFACFVAGQHCSQIQYVTWEQAQLSAVQLRSLCQYQVNG